MDIAEILDKGGIIVWLLLGYSFISLIIVIERLIHYSLTKKPVKDFEQGLDDAIRQQNVGSWLKNMHGPEARLMQAIYSAWKNNIHDLQSVASRKGSEELIRMQRGFRTLSIMGNTAPLLGLLGTIIGMIKAFMVIQVAGGQVDAQALAGGIWEAMLTTGVGLAVSIPILLILHFLEGITERRAITMKDYSMQLLERISHLDEADEQNQTTALKKGLIHAV